LPISIAASGKNHEPLDLCANCLRAPYRDTLAAT